MGTMNSPSNISGSIDMLHHHIEKLYEQKMKEFQRDMEVSLALQSKTRSLIADSALTIIFLSYRQRTVNR